MRITYQRDGDMGYIYLVDSPGPGEFARSVVVNDPALADQLVIDLDRNGRMLGIEVFAASRLIPKALLDTAQILDEEQ